MQNSIANIKMVHAGGWFLIVFTLLYTTQQLILFLLYNFHAIPESVGTEALTKLLAGGVPLQILLSVSAFIPLLLIPGSIGAYYAFQERSEPWMRVSVIFATLAAFSLTLCLLRWPAMVWHLAHSYFNTKPDQLILLNGVMQIFNDYLGVFVGSIFSTVCASIWFFIVSAAMLKAKNIPRWIGYLGIIASIYLLMTLVDPFNVILPSVARVFHSLNPLVFLWLMVFGISLLFYSDPEASI